jgi:prevent-host-death family protein
MAVDLLSVAELRAKLAEVIASLRRARRPIYITQRGQARAVLMDVDEYRSLIDQLEFFDDSLEALLAKERREGGKEKTEPLEVVLRRLRKRGRLPR